MAPGGPRLFADEGEIAAHLLAGFGRVQQALDLAGYAFRREVVLNQFRERSLSGDQVDHGEIGCATRRRAIQAVKRRYAVDDHHGRADQGGFDGGRAAGDDGHVGCGQKRRRWRFQRSAPWT